MITRTVVTSFIATCAVMGWGLAACGPSRPNTDTRLWTDSYAIRISADPVKPVAELMTRYKVVVKDKETGQPIETGEGRIFASTNDLVQIDNGLAKGDEVGTYYTELRFPVSGEWAMGFQFRRDSTAILERSNDWAQTVVPAPPLGSAAAPEPAPDTGADASPVSGSDTGSDTSRAADSAASPQ